MVDLSIAGGGSTAARGRCSRKILLVLALQMALLSGTQKPASVLQSRNTVDGTMQLVYPLGPAGKIEALSQGVIGFPCVVGNGPEKTRHDQSMCESLHINHRTLVHQCTAKPRTSRFAPTTWQVSTAVKIVRMIMAAPKN